MASGMRRITVKELKEVLEGMEENEAVGCVFTAQEGYGTPVHQVIVLYKELLSF